jgi:glutamine amidotransferase
VIAIVDHGVGNFANVGRALERAGAQGVRLTSSADDLGRARAIVLPGVGHFGHCARALRRDGLADALHRSRERGVPLLGLCVGMQLLFERSEEDPGEPGLGLLAGAVRRLRGAPRVPHTGWNAVRLRRTHPYLAGLRDGGHYYFVHSYAPEPDDPEAVLATTDHGAEIAAVVGGPGLVGAQFHPEKSGATGAAFLASFVGAL